MKDEKREATREEKEAMEAVIQYQHMQNTAFGLGDLGPEGRQIIAKYRQKAEDAMSKLRRK